MAWTRALRTRYTVHVPERHGVLFWRPRGKICCEGHHAQSASWTQNMNMHLKTKNQKGIRQHTQHTVGPIEQCTTKVHSANIDGTNAECRLDMGVAAPQNDDGRHPPEALRKVGVARTRGGGGTCTATYYWAEPRYTLSTDCPQTVHRLSTDCPQIVHRLSTDCRQIRRQRRRHPLSRALYRVFRTGH